MENKILFIDGNSILYRGFYGTSPLINSKGKYVQGVFGFINIMSKYMRQLKPTHMAIAFDLPEETFRKEMYEDYKGTRHEAPEGFKDSFEPLFEMLEAMGIKTLSLSGYEGDDILGSLSKKFQKDGKTVILSGDKDTFQLINENTTVYMPRGKSVTEKYDEERFEREYEIKPSEFADMKALMGDTSDNIPGVKGIGPKTAKELIKEYSSIENLYEKIEEVEPKRVRTFLENGKEEAFFSKKLSTIKTDIETDVSLSEIKTHPIKNEKVMKLAKELGISSYIIL